MINDIRLKFGIHRSFKIKKLIADKGFEAFFCYTGILCWAGESERYDGDLSGVSDEDLEIQVDWSGERGALIEALARHGLLDGSPYARCVHDWDEHQPYLAATPRRKKAASAGGLARAAKLRGQSAAPVPPTRQEFAVHVQEPISDSESSTPQILHPTAQFAPTEEMAAQAPAPIDYPDDLGLPSPDVLLENSGDPASIARAMYDRCRPQDWASIAGRSAQWLTWDVLKATSVGHGARQDMTCGELWGAMRRLQIDDVSWVNGACRNINWLLKENGARLWRAMSGGLAKVEIQPRSRVEDTQAHQDWLLEEAIKLSELDAARRAEREAARQ